MEHQLFSYISKNWQGRPLIDIETVIELIGLTTTTTGLKVTCIPDYDKYELGKKVTDKEFNNLPIRYINNLGKRNYVIGAVEEI